MKMSSTNHTILLLLFCLVAVSGIFVHVKLWDREQRIEQEDVYYTFVVGSRLIEGINPYTRVLLGDMRTNQKYATYLPLFYLLSSCTQLLGLQGFPEWLAFWRVIFLGCNIGICYLIFKICDTREQSLLGIFGALFWLFNRWTLHVTVIAHIDFLPLFLLLLSLSLLRRRSYLACVLFGLSLAIKQMAIFAIPVYLIWFWRTNRQDRLKQTLVSFALIVAIPLLASIPFLIWNAEGFIKSILFSATRYPSSHSAIPSLDAFAGVCGIPAKIPMLFFLGLVYALALLTGIPLNASLLLVMIVFVCFNSVLFRQYMVWPLPFIPLALAEISSVNERVIMTPDS
jgi:uncharacterized membrane protein